MKMRDAMYCLAKQPDEERDKEVAELEELDRHREAAKQKEE